MADETIDHDRIFKELLTTFFVEFVEAFLPDVAAYLEPESLVFLDKEVFTDITEGRNLKSDDVRALNHVRERELAEIALFISLDTPTKGMIADAASAGFYTGAAGNKFPRVQLLTIDGLLSGKQRAEHPDHQPDLNFKKAKAEANAEQKALL